MKRNISMLVLLVLFAFVVCCNRTEAAQLPEETEDDWRAQHAEIYNHSYQREKDGGGYVVSREELTDLSVDFGFDLSDLKYDVVKALVKTIYDRNQYTSYEFYEHSIDEDIAMHQATGTEFFNVVFDKNDYWLIYYRQDKAYALYDDSGMTARRRTAEALAAPGEEVLFGFQLKDSSEWVVVCSVEPDRDYLVCRMGNPQDLDIALEYPRDKNRSMEKFTITFGSKESEEEPKNGEVQFMKSLACEDETFIYTIQEDLIYRDGTYDPELSLNVENKQTGEMKIYEGRGERSETVGALNNHLTGFIRVLYVEL